MLVTAFSPTEHSVPAVVCPVAKPGLMPELEGVELLLRAADGEDPVVDEPARCGRLYWYCVPPVDCDCDVDPVDIPVTAGVLSDEEISSTRPDWPHLEGSFDACVSREDEPDDGSGERLTRLRLFGVFSSPRKLGICAPFDHGFSGWNAVCLISLRVSRPMGSFNGNRPGNGGMILLCFEIRDRANTGMLAPHGGGAVPSSGISGRIVTLGMRMRPANPERCTSSTAWSRKDLVIACCLPTASIARRRNSRLAASLGLRPCSAAITEMYTLLATYSASATRGLL